jgi:poly(3-hydroxybutyrate) depolymerase
MMGDCPEFRNGTIMAAGHRGVSLSVGEGGKSGPVLFYWHGTGSSAAESTGWAGNSEIVSMGGIVASFNGSQSAGGGMDCSGTGAHNMSDFLATDLIVACGVASKQIDPARVYSTGCSAGGLQAGCMAMVRSSYVAAVAPNSGGVVFPLPWQDANSPAIFTMHGGAADVVIVTFSETSASLDMAAKSHGSFVVNCNHGGGHCLAPASLEAAAWQFMKDHPFGASKMSPWMAGLPSGTPSSCMIY